MGRSKHDKTVKRVKDEKKELKKETKPSEAESHVGVHKAPTESRRKRRFHPGNRALLDIKKQQKRTSNVKQSPLSASTY